ncbi:MAG: C25 family cysteine peptidase [Candidatus Eisenbacteria bacterium]
MRSGISRSVRALIPVVLMAVIVWAGTASPAPLEDYEIVSQDESHITFTVRLPRYDLQEVTTEGKTYSTIFADGLTPIADAGQPHIPVFAVMLAVPEGATVSLESFTRSGVTALEGVRVIPVARLEARGEGANRFADNIYDEDESIYGGVSPFPADQVWVTDRGRMRHQDVVRVFVSPFVYEPARERLTVAREITVTVGFEGRVRLGGAPPVEDRWEHVYEDVLLNYDQGKRWRARRAAPLMKSTVANDRLKILIERTGMHKLEFDSLSAVGFPEGIAVDEIFLYRDEFYEGSPDSMAVVESAIDLSDNDQNGFFSSGDEVLFYGKDLREQFGYRGNEDLFFDYNVYWLSWGQGEHERIGSRSGWREDAAPSMPGHFSDFLHMEEDIVFSNFPPLNPVYEEYDLFYWARYLASFPFDLPGVHPDYPCSLVINFISYYNDPSGKTKIHNVDILASGCAGVMEDIATRSLYVPGHVRAFYEVDAGFFCDTGNIFKIDSSVSSNWTPGHTVDWFEIIYEREFEAHEDNVAFTNGGMTGELEFEIAGFSTSDIVLYDISDPVAPVKLDVPLENIVVDGGGFSVTFRDSLGGDAAYFSLCDPGLVEIGMHQLSLVDPPSLRNIAASYVVISHPDFVAELDPLLAKREEQGHTTFLATTEEVYDDFGNGMKSDVAIQRFIEHCFFGGGTEFALLVGDANVDRKGKLNVQQPGQARSDVDYLPSHNMIFVDLLTPGNTEIRPNDNWFAQTDGPGDSYPDLYIGRLSVGSASEAAGVVTKILNFENDPGGDSWKKRMVLIADDEFGTNSSSPSQFLCYTGQNQFKAACESSAVIARDFSAVPVDTVKHYLERCLVDDQSSVRDAHGCPDYYTTLSYTSANCTPGIVQDLNAGAFMVNFQGHANRWQFTHEQVLYDFNPRKDILGLTNRTRPFIFIGFGCWISDFQWLAEPILTDAIGEKFLLNPNGAACASFASGCSDPIIYNQAFNGYVTRAFLTHLQGKDAHGADIPARGQELQIFPLTLRP